MAANKTNKRYLELIILWLPVAICMAVIFFASCAKGEEVPCLFPLQDIVYHFLAYLALSLAFTRATKKTFLNLNRSQVIILTIIFVAIYGLIDEVHQSFVPGRCVSGLDLAINTIGAVAGSLIYA